MRFFSINGEQESAISIADRSFNYGDGFFTTALILKEKIQFEQLHCERLVLTAQKLGIEQFDVEQALTYAKLATKGIDKAVLKVLVTAGQGGRGYSRKGSSKPNVIVSVHDFPEHYDKWCSEGIKLGVSSMKLGINPLLAGLKHNNRLEQVLIRKELDAIEVDDVIVLDINDQVIETSAANIGYLSNGQWYTPTLDTAGVNGVMRQLLLSKRLIQEQPTKLCDIEQAEALFICNSILGIAPVNQFNASKLSIEPVTALKQAFL